MRFSLLNLHSSLTAGSVVVAATSLLGDWDSRATILHIATTIQLTSLLLCAAISDLRTHRIPNHLTYSTLLGGLCLLAVTMLSGDAATGLTAFYQAVQGSALCGLLMGLFWLMRAVGGGDVKLVLALGMFLGSFSALSAILLAHLLAAAWMIAMTILRQRIPLPVAAGAANTPPQIPPSTAVSRGARIPMGGFYALGVVAVSLAPWLSI